MDRRELSGSIVLPTSKSISNRLLILNALAEKPGKLDNLSASEDTKVLAKALATTEGTIDIGHAGTAMRFLTAYLSIGNRNFILTGSDRMLQRPIGELVNAMNALGARIEYRGNPGYPPLFIQGSRIQGGEISVDSSISSQYISALMMIGPVLKNGLTIRLQKKAVSFSYLQLTRNLMLELDIPVRFEGNSIEIPHTRFRGMDISVEGDWSAASYWYAIVALIRGDARIEIKGLLKDSYQGDSVLPELFRPLGVETEFGMDGIIIRNIPLSQDKFEFDFGDNPDLVQTLAVLCSLINLPFRMTGTRTLKIKETDRIQALQAELKKLGVLLDADPGGKWISWDGKKRTSMPQTLQIKTYQDHRMAMAFSPAAIVYPDLVIEDPEVVQKSYPGFWSDLEAMGFRLEKLD
jgi:3-phosphoshikimate 1-carboxyvinyltransferase